MSTAADQAVDEMRAAAARGERDARAGRDRHHYRDSDVQAAYDVAYDDNTPAGDDQKKPRKIPAKKKRAPSRRRPRGRARRRSSTGKALKKGARDIAKPAALRTGSALTFVGMTLAVIVLYDLIEGADVVGGFLQGPNKALAWIADPTKSIPYH